MPNENKTIKLSYYNTLERSHKLLMALQECGVDNWEGYSEAMKLAFGEEEDNDE